MRILIVGGTGMVGGDAALRLTDMGHDVTLASRKPLAGNSRLAKLPFERVDYVNEEPDAAMLSRFDAVIFAAGNDPRHVPKGEDVQGWWHKSNSLAVPRYAKAAREAGVRHFILIGSFYPQAAPHLLGTNAYIDSRLGADEGTRALASDSYHVVVLNAPFIVGHVEGVVQPGAQAYTNWATGKMPSVPLTMIPGGVNVISTATLTDAIIGALERGENGKAYLVGDENMTFKAYLETYFRAAGNPVDLALDETPHPMLGTGSVLGGIGSTLWYDADPAEVAQLGYRQGDVERSIRELVDAYR